MAWRWLALFAAASVGVGLDIEWLRSAAGSRLEIARALTLLLGPIGVGTAGWVRCRRDAPLPGFPRHKFWRALLAFGTTTALGPLAGELISPVSWWEWMVAIAGSLALAWWVWDRWFVRLLAPPLSPAEARWQIWKIRRETLRRQRAISDQFRRDLDAAIFETGRKKRAR
jgi:hypothetical protein